MLLTGADIVLALANKAKVILRGDRGLLCEINAIPSSNAQPVYTILNGTSREGYQRYNLSFSLALELVTTELNSQEYEEILLVV
jgi:hypothetical protein